MISPLYRISECQQRYLYISPLMTWNDFTGSLTGNFTGSLCYMAWTPWIKETALQICLWYIWFELHGLLAVSSSINSAVINIL